MNIYPMKLRPVLKSYIWGGGRLAERYGKTGTGNVAESWELACNKQGESVVDNGAFAGKTLSELLGEHPDWIGSRAGQFEFFPVLVKLIDAAGDLSVQVHPDDAYALSREGQYGKTEMWYVVESEKGAGMYCGFRKPVDKSELEKSLRDGTVTDLLNFVEVKRGDVLFIPSGTVHAICKGVVVYEVQQNSTLTYRLYDYGRKGADGKERELHIDKALEVSDTSKVCRPGDGVKEISDGVTELASCRYFTSVRYDAKRCRGAYVSDASFSAFTCVGGSGSISVGGVTCDVCAGDTFFVPAGAGEVVFGGDAVLIEAKTV